jgi:hypothetical protein
VVDEHCSIIEEVVGVLRDDADLQRAQATVQEGQLAAEQDRPGRAAQATEVGKVHVGHVEASLAFDSPDEAGHLLKDDSLRSGVSVIEIQRDLDVRGSEEPILAIRKTE